MERSAIRFFFVRNTMPPDFAALHPGYSLLAEPHARALRVAVKTDNVAIRCIVGTLAQEKQPCPAPFDCTAS
jgi:hypothetical protein